MRASEEKVMRTTNSYAGLARSRLLSLRNCLASYPCARLRKLDFVFFPGSGSWADVVLCCNRGTSSRSRSANIPPSLRKRLTPSRCIRKTSLQVDEVLPSIVQCHRLGPANQALFQDLISLYYLYQRLTKTCIGTEGLSVSDGKREDT